MSLFWRQTQPGHDLKHDKSINWEQHGEQLDPEADRCCSCKVWHDRPAVTFDVTDAIIFHYMNDVVMPTFYTLARHGIVPDHLERCECDTYLLLYRGRLLLLLASGALNAVMLHNRCAQLHPASKRCSGTRA